MSRMLILYLGSLMLRSLGVAVVAAVCTWRMKNVARRHAVWLAVLGIMLLMPGVDMALPTAPFSAPPTITVEPMEPSAAVSTASAITPAGLQVTAIDATPAKSVGWNGWQIATMLYGVIALLLALQMALAHHKLSTIKRATRKVSTDLFDGKVAELRESDSLRIPLTMGYLKPIVILPSDWRAWDEWKLRAVLTHEMAHVRRADWAIAMLAGLNTIAFWYNPLSWWLERRIAALCEESSDEASISAVGDPARYSEILLEFATGYNTERLPVGGVAMARRNIASRIERILTIERPGSGILTRTAIGLMVLLSIPVLFAASAIHASTESAVSAITVRMPVPMVTRPAPSATVVFEPTVRSTAQRPTPDIARPADTPKWETVSIKPCDGSGPSHIPTPVPGKLNLYCQTVKNLLQEAYLGYQNLTWSLSTPVEGAPDWTNVEAYDIDAKATGDASQAMMLGPMLQTILEDRFKLKIRRETRDMPVYVMTVANGGFKLQPVKDEGCTPLDLTMWGQFPPFPPNSCPFMIRLGMGNSIEAERLSMDDLSKVLLRILRRPVINDTRIAGRFNVDVITGMGGTVASRFEPREPSATGNVVLAGVLFKRPSPGEDVNQPFIIALQEQLGLKLEPTTGPGEVFVIDQVERPIPN